MSVDPQIQHAHEKKHEFGNVEKERGRGHACSMVGLGLNADAVAYGNRKKVPFQST